MAGRASKNWFISIYFWRWWCGSGGGPSTPIKTENVRILGLLWLINRIHHCPSTLFHLIFCALFKSIKLASDVEDPLFILIKTRNFLSAHRNFYSIATEKVDFKNDGRSSVFVFLFPPQFCKRGWKYKNDCNDNFKLWLFTFLRAIFLKDKRKNFKQSSPK